MKAILRHRSFWAITPMLVLAWLVPVVATSTAGTFREVSFETSDGGVIHGNLYGNGEHAVILAHGAVFDKESWDPLALHLAVKGMRVLAIDFRGYGDSKGGSRGAGLHLDILGAIGYLKGAGAKRVSVLGGSMGGTAAAKASVESKEGDIDRLILLAAASSGDAAKLKGKILFIVAEGDGSVRGVKRAYAEAPEPKKLVLLPGKAHAQHIFKTDQAGALTKAIVDWLGGESGAGL